MTVYLNDVLKDKFDDAVLLMHPECRVDAATLKEQVAVLKNEYKEFDGIAVFKSCTYINSGGSFSFSKRERVSYRCLYDVNGTEFAATFDFLETNDAKGIASVSIYKNS